MDAENGWHRHHIQRLYEKRQEERKRREMQQRYLINLVMRNFYF